MAFGEIPHPLRFRQCRHGWGISRRVGLLSLMKVPTDLRQAPHSLEDPQKHHFHQERGKAVCVGHLDSKFSGLSLGLTHADSTRAGQSHSRGWCVEALLGVRVS